MSEAELFLARYSFGSHGQDAVSMIPQIRTEAEQFFSEDPIVCFRR